MGFGLSVSLEPLTIRERDTGVWKQEPWDLQILCWGKQEVSWGRGEKGWAESGLYCPGSHLVF